jgi:peptidoglycan/LPS O-acetylase OafA/YrhL
MNVAKNRLVGLDALRGIAALFVTLLHLDGLYQVPSYFEHADLMVDFFFMLSGYIMARTYENRLGEIGTIQFVSLRFRRLWPPIAIGVLIGAVFRLSTEYVWQDVTILLGIGLLLAPNEIMAHDPFDLNPPEWSATIELVANLTHALILRRLGVRALLGVALLSAMIMLFWANGFPARPELSFGLNTARVLLSYSIGIAIWRVLGDQPRLPFWIAVTGLPGIMMGCWLIWPQGDMTFYVPIIAFLLPIVLIAGLNAPRSKPIVRLSTAAGALSFPLYAVHYPIMSVVHVAHGPKWLAFCGALTVAFVVAVLLGNKLGRKAGNERTARSALAV